MKILTLGGTKFLGRAAVETALERGHDVTLFNRGETNPDLFPDVEKLRGDRTADLSALENRRWDAVIDPSGYLPHVVRASAEALRDSTDRYLFVSSVSVYADLSSGPDEDAPRGQLGDMPADELREDYENYGPLKALCEDAVWEVYGDRAIIVRPGLIVGPNDPTGRFTYWPHRVARGGEVLVPGDPENIVQFIDARDLGAWMVDLLERGESGRVQRHPPRRLVGRADRGRAHGVGLRRHTRLRLRGVSPAARGRRVDGAAPLARRPGLGRHEQG